MASQYQLTLYDMVTSLASRSSATPVFSTGGTLSDSTVRFIRSSQDAVRSLPQRHKWKYLQRTLRFRTTESLTAEATYTASTNLLVLADDEWPDDAASGWVQIDNVWYGDLVRVDDETIRIDDALAPTDNATDVDITWCRDAYTIPNQITELHSVRSSSSRCQLYYNTPQGIASLHTAGRMIGSPSQYTWSGSTLSGASQMILYPSPSTEEIFEAQVTLAPTVPMTYSVLASDAVVNIDAGTLSSAVSSFKRNIVGSLVYMANEGDTEVDIRDNAAVLAVITGFTSKTALTFTVLETYSALSPTTGVGIFITSPVDIEEGVMLEYLEDMAYSNYCKYHFHKGLQQAMAIERESFIRALEADNRTNGNSTSGVLDANFYRNLPPDPDSSTYILP